MVAICRDHAANARAWRDGQMALRWVAAGMGEAAKQFRRVISPITASAAIYASAAHADEREAHIREVKRYGQSLPEGSYGRCNRQAIAARETRIAARRHAVEHAYRMSIERDAAFMPPEPTGTLCSPGHAPDREIELE
jgi:hypothetical protein